MTVYSGGVARLRQLIDAQRGHERWRDLATALRNLPRAFRLVWNAHRLGLAGLAALTLVAAGMPLAQAWTGKLIVDAVVQAITAGQPVAAGLQATLPLLLLEFFLIALNAVLGQTRSLLDHVIHARVDHTVTSAIITKAVAQDLQTFEDPAFYDKLQNARRDGGRRALGSVTTALTFVQQTLTLGSFAVLLLAFSPLVGLILVGATIPSFLAQARYSSLHFRLLSWRAPEQRRMQYLQQVLTVDSSAKEVKLFGLGAPLFGQYEAMFWRLFREDSALALRRSRASVLWGLLNSASYYAAYAYIVWRTLNGSITLGDMTLYLTLCRQSQGAFQSVLGSVNGLFESGLFLNHLYEFLDLEPRINTLPGARAVPRPIMEGIEFRDVGFRYPGREEWAVRHVSFSIAPGEKLALVGANGAGKTTLIKLLTRLYDPTEGSILLDGVDLRAYDLDDLRMAIGVIFQDFVRYQASVRDNIGYGQIGALEDQERIVAAAERGGADEVVAALPDGYDAMLGRWFDRGHELSGGQWQKIALGRAFMRDGAVLVLDEPTAALDAEREYAVFQRFRDLTAGKIAVLISHRFSTVRMADRIAVLDGGRLTELGSHAELLEHDGTYARLFNLQAAGYR